MPERGFVISIFSPAGSQGVSFVATQLTSHLAKFGTSCVVDLNVEFGTTLPYLNLPPLDRAATFKAITSEDVDKVRNGSRHLPNCVLKYDDKFSVLGAPSELSMVNSEYASTIIESCRREFQFTVLDLPHSLQADAVATALKLSDLIVVVADPATADTVCKFDKLLTDGKIPGGKNKVLYVLNHVWKTDVFGQTRSVRDAAVGILIIGALLTRIDAQWLGMYRTLCIFSVLILFLLFGFTQILMLFPRKPGTAKLVKQQIQIFHELSFEPKSCKLALNQGKILQGYLRLGRQLKTLASKIQAKLLTRGD
jgi:MinD-like ATPase involved in chromosome partitioning or flagellar assembly